MIEEIIRPMSLVLYHNGECSKSKGALKLLIENQIPHTVRWYLADPLTKEELVLLLQKLGLKASDLIRKNENVFKEDYAGKITDESEYFELLVNHPVLMERPIGEMGNRALIARPPERIFELIQY